MQVPHTDSYFISLSMMRSKVREADVLAEKLTMLLRYSSEGKDSRWSTVTTDLPVPVGPTKSSGRRLSRHVRKKNCMQAVSGVGTSILLL